MFVFLNIFLTLLIIVFLSKNKNHCTESRMDHLFSMIFLHYSAITFTILTPLPEHIFKKYVPAATGKVSSIFSPV